MYAFEYFRASSVADAVAQTGEDVVYLAGGQSLLGAMRLRLSAPRKLVDLGRIGDLRGVEQGGDVVTIKAMTTHATVAADPVVRQRIPALADLAGSIGDRQVRNSGTIGGSIATNDPSADYPAGVVGLGATVVTDQREIAADELFTGMYETALQPGELIVAVRFPVPSAAGYYKFRQEASRFALVGVFVARFGKAVRVAVTGAGPCVFRCAPLEEALAADFSPAAARKVAVPQDDMMGDIHAAPDYRAHLVSVIAARAVAKAAG